MIELLLVALAAYLALGALFAGPFVLIGVGRIDPHAATASWGFRLVIVPGVILLWPTLARRWWRGKSGWPEERTAHRLAAALPARREGAAP